MPPLSAPHALPATLASSSWFRSLPAGLQSCLQSQAQLLVLPASPRLAHRLLLMSTA